MTIAKFAGSILLPGLLLLPLYSVGQETTSAMERQATAFLHTHYSERFPDAQIKININQLNSKFKQHQCTNPLIFTAPRNISARPLLKVSCNGSRTWMLYLRATASVEHNAVVVRTSIKRGLPIDPAMVEFERIDALRYPDTFTSFEELSGMIAKRTLSPGKVLTPRDLKLAPAVNKGDAIMIEARRSGLSIRTAGIAGQSGHIGEQIQAVNNRSGKEVRGIIKSRGLIVVP